jgi:molecular chaperone IbpA
MVVESADIANGLLHVAIKRVVPEALKPRRVEINTVTAPKAIEGQGQLSQAA